MFNSNVQPKVKKINLPKESWSCMSCSVENPHYLSKCKECNTRRPH
jgi:hypothetical protein